MKRQSNPKRGIQEDQRATFAGYCASKAGQRVRLTPGEWTRVYLALARKQARMQAVRS